MIDDLVAWLSAVLDEDERVALEAVRWSEGCTDWADGGNPDWVHIARHDPAAILADIAAKRSLIADLAAEKHLVVGDSWYTCAAATEEREGETTGNIHEPEGGPCNCGLDERVDRRLRLLASAYVHQPGYRQEWAPQ